MTVSDFFPFGFPASFLAGSDAGERHRGALRDTRLAEPVLRGARLLRDAHAHPVVPAIASVAADHRRTVVRSAARRTNPYFVALFINIIRGREGFELSVGGRGGGGCRRHGRFLRQRCDFVFKVLVALLRQRLEQYPFVFRMTRGRALLGR